MNISNIKNICFFGAESIEYACNDLKNDFALVGNENINVFNGNGFCAGSVTVGSFENPDFANKYKELGFKVPSGWEQYVVNIENDRITVCGSDERGTIFGIYAVSRELGILPGIRFVDQIPNKIETLENKEICSTEHTYKFRGWFINDEDLLTNWNIKHSRTIDYPFYENIISLKAIEMIAETALRMNMNMIIPATLLDIDDPNEEEIVAYLAKRGLMITQHHIEPLGVSHWYYADYMTKHGKDTEFSFVNKKENAIEVWNYYVSKWAKYKDHVIWQLGLRGKADRPVWENDNSDKGMKEWGAIISEAIQTQYDIVEKYCGKEFYSTATLWMEGATLYLAGALKLPEKTTMVFSDVGPTQMLSQDFYDAKREKNHTFGLYYHFCYWGDGPHHAQGVSWKKMEYNYKKSYEYGDREYSIANVSNIRPFILTLEAYSRITNNLENFRAKDAYREISAQYFGNAQMGEILEEYFDCFVSVPTAKLVKKYEQFFSFHHGEYEDFSYYTATDGFIKWLGREGIDGIAEQYWQEELENSIAKFEKLLAKTEKIQANEYKSMLIYQIKHMILFQSWALHGFIYGRNKDVHELEIAISFLEKILEIRPEMEQGIWKDWFKGDKKIGIPYLIEETNLVIKNGFRKDLII